MKIHQKSTIIIFVKVFTFILCCGTFYNFSILEPKTRSFTVTESVHYELPIGFNIDEYSKLDILKFRPRSSQKRHTDILFNDEYSEEIFFNKTSRILPSWMPETEKIIYSINHTKVYKKSLKGKPSEVKTFKNNSIEKEDFISRKNQFIHEHAYSKFESGQDILAKYKNDVSAIITQKNECQEIATKNLLFKVFPNNTYTKINFEKGTSTHFFPESFMSIPTVDISHDQILIRYGANS